MTIPLKTATSGSSKKNASTPAKSAGASSKAQTVAKPTAAFGRSIPPPAPKKRATVNSIVAGTSFGELPPTRRRTVKPKLPALRLDPFIDQTTVQPVIAMADKSKMPNPQSRDAPSFDAEKPGELVRFISRMEDLYKKYGVTDDKEKIEMLGKYADAKSENEWCYLKAYKGADFTKFKKELVNSYPEAADQERGSLKKLVRLCKEHKGIDQTDLAELKSLVRGFVAEVGKLQEPPALLSNREAVERFLGCLDDDFRNSVQSRLEILTKVDENAVRSEDRFQLDDVIDTALSIGQGSRTSYKPIATRAAPAGSSSRPVISDTAVKVEADISHLKDSFTVQSRQSEAGLKQLHNKIEELTRLMTQSRVMSQNAGAPPPRYNQPDQRGSRLSTNCFYCNDPNHMKNECPHKEEHLLKGWILIDALGRIRLADGRQVPWGKPGDSVKERVELVQAEGRAARVNVAVRQRTPGIIQLSQNVAASGASTHGHPSAATQEDVEDLLDQLDLNDVQQYLYGKVQKVSEQENF